MSCCKKYRTMSACSQRCCKPKPCVDFCTLDGISTAVKENIADITSSGHYYVTPEMCRELKHIDNGVNHIHLDADILKNQQWKEMCDPGTVCIHQHGATNALQLATERLLDVKEKMCVNKVHCSVDDQVREDHHTTIQDLKEIEQDMKPYVNDSMVRIRQYCDHVGVTDRYTSYRNHQNRGNRHPINLAFSWLDPSYKNPNIHLKFRPESDKVYQQIECNDIYRSKAHSAPPASRRCVLNPCVKPLSIQEQCGINMTYPGITEYTDRYAAPRRDLPTQDFIINPTPDYRINGRPMARQRYLCTETEYQHRFEWPDGNRLKLFPWLRK